MTHARTTLTNPNTGSEFVFVSLADPMLIFAAAVEFAHHQGCAPAEVVVDTEWPPAIVVPDIGSLLIH